MNEVSSEEVNAAKKMKYVSPRAPGADRDLGIHIERQLCESFLRPLMFWPQMENSENWKVGREVKNIFVF